LREFSLLSWLTLIAGGRVGRRNEKSGYLEDLYQASFNRENVLHHLIDDQCAVNPAHNLVDIHSYFVAVALKVLRVNAGIHQFPLACPIVPDSFVAVNIASVHAVCPGYIRMHAGQATVDVAGIEGGVEIG
jgi:hypothetical protein